MLTDDTIAAISTPMGEGGIAIIRVSGPSALSIADQLFVSRTGKPSLFASHTMHFGSIVDDGQLVDNIMLSVMRQPRTYTGEDVVEINCHGGIVTTRRILRLCLQAGARLAEPGEFTRRAFLNGKLDLAQAESVMDLIQARTERAQSVAAQVLEGHLSTKVNRIRDQLTTILAHVEAHIDFPDEDISPATMETLVSDLNGIALEIHRLLATALEGKILREGVPVAIVGRPNAGKSSIMNALLGQERSIVTPIAGTTRDTIEEYANIRGLPIRFTDTAGIRQARGKIEHAGIERSRKALNTCVIALHILDGSRAFHVSDAELRHHTDGKTVLVVINKIDLPRKLKLPDEWTGLDPVEVSAKTEVGLEQLKDRLATKIMGEPQESTRVEVAINERHAKSLQNAYYILTQSIDSMKRHDNIEVIAQGLRLTLDAVGEIVGKTTTDDILAKIFSTFCIGK
jgi:tRNA modification GTPase